MRSTYVAANVAEIAAFLRKLADAEVQLAGRGKRTEKALHQGRAEGLEHAAQIVEETTIQGGK